MKLNRSVTRRSFLKGMTAASFFVRGGDKLVADETSAPDSREKLLAFAYSDVKLTGGPLKAQWDRIHASYLKLDEDRLLKVYRQRAGLPAPGEDLGGWYDADGFGPGQVFGQFISGLARFYSTSGDAATLAKVQRLVTGFGATIDSQDYWYPSLKASTASPAYTLDKILAGLLDAYNLAGVGTACDLARRCVKGSIPYLPDRAYEHSEAPRQARTDETYTLPENLYYLYETTRDPTYRELAGRYLMDRSYLDPLSRNQNVLPGLHAYSHVNALCSAARAYLNIGEPKYLLAAQNAWEMITTTQSYASGGWAPKEKFLVPGRGLLGESLTNTHDHFETPCGSYAHLKLCRYLLRFTGESRCGDSLERVLYNTVLGAKDPDGDGHFFYYSDYHPDTQKAYYPNKWPCCSGTLPQVVADYVISAYFHSNDGIYVNLFSPSEVHWKVQGTPVKITQQTSYPASDSAEFLVEPATPVEFTIYFRIPGWLELPARLSVNDHPVSTAAQPGSFAAIRRRWQTNDAVQIQLPFSLRPEPIDEQHPDTVALMWGPLMLVALDPPPQLSRRSLSPSPGGLQPTPHSPLRFETPRATSKVAFMPFYQVRDETYTTYVNLT